MHGIAVGDRRATPEPPGRRPAVFGASGDVWQRDLDRLWRRPGDPDGRTWFELGLIDGGDGYPVPIPAPIHRPLYTDELPTVEITSRIPA